MKSVPLRRRLFLLVAAALLPLTIVSALALLYLYRQSREQAERSVLEVARAMSIAVDAELGRTSAVLEVLSSSLSLDEDNLANFYERARRAHDGQRFWLALILFDGSGRQLINTAFAYGAPLPEAVESESLHETVAARRPLVGYLAKGPRGAWGVPVRVPILRGNQVRYVLTAAVDPRAVLEVLERTRVPGEWVIAVSDAKNIRVARTVGQEQLVGTPFSPTLMEMMTSGSREGTGVTRNSEGVDVFTSFTRSTETRWVTAVGLPVSGVEANARRSFYTFGAGLLLSVALGLAAALVIGRSVSEPMDELRQLAVGMGSREGARMLETDVREIQDVAAALADSERERQRAEAEREDLLRSEQAARAVAERANRAKDEFLAMLGHELRNPLGAISNAAALLSDGRLSEDRRGQAGEIIARQTKHLTRLTDDLLDAGRAVMGKIVLQRHPVDLAACARQTLAALRSSSRTQRHRVAEDLEPVWIDADAIRIDQVVGNLVVNAVKYSPPGSQIRVSVRREGNEAVLRVADEGIGIPPELAPRVFDLFVQGDRDLDRAQGGLGIGLTLVRRLAEMHGGSATLKSDGDDRGSEFVVRIPAIEAPALKASHDARPGQGIRARDILVVEDNADARETLRVILEMHGHRVHVESDGESGLATALREKPDVMLVDVGLPRMDGYEVARRVRAADGWPHRPLLVAITGYGQESDRRLALEAGFDAHVAKPAEPDTLLGLIERGAPTSS
jgi:signal transduction histidine kinase